MQPRTTPNGLNVKGQSEMPLFSHAVLVYKENEISSWSLSIMYDGNFWRDLMYPKDFKHFSSSILVCVCTVCVYVHQFIILTFHLFVLGWHRKLWGS